MTGGRAANGAMSPPLAGLKVAGARTGQAASDLRAARASSKGVGGRLEIGRLVSARPGIGRANERSMVAGARSTRRRAVKIARRGRSARSAPIGPTASVRSEIAPAGKTGRAVMIGPAAKKDRKALNLLGVSVRLEIGHDVMTGLVGRQGREGMTGREASVRSKVGRASHRVVMTSPAVTIASSANACPRCARRVQRLSRSLPNRR